MTQTVWKLSFLDRSPARHMAPVLADFGLDLSIQAATLGEPPGSRDRNTLHNESNPLPLRIGLRAANPALQ